MDLNTITEVKRPGIGGRDRRSGATAMPGSPAAPGCSPSRSPRRHADRSRAARLAGAARPRPTGSTIAATCRIAELYRLRRRRPNGRAAPLFRECCDAFLASFKIWNAATVGGNICMSLPAGPMISLTAALEGVCTLWPRDGDAARGAGRRLRHRQPRQCPAAGRIAAQHPPARRGAAQALRLPPRLAHQARPLGGAADRHAAARRGDFLLTITAATAAPGSAPLRRDRRPRRSCSGAIDDAIPARRVFRRRARLGRLQAPPHATTSPNRSAPSWRSRSAHERSDRHDATRRQRPASVRGRAASPASACAPSCATSAGSASRRAATPAIAAPARSGSTASRSIPA